jgi:hypothetical protein
MRTRFLLLALGLGALVATSLAAASSPTPPATADVGATFTANATRTSTRTCTGAGGVTLRITNAVWRGTATSTEPRLNGTLVLRTRSVVNVATGDGWLNGSWQSRNSNPTTPAKSRGREGANASLIAVVDETTHIDGLALGRVHRPWGHLRGNFSAAIAGEAITGSLGVNAPVAPDNSAIVFRTGCR